MFLKYNLWLLNIHGLHVELCDNVLKLYAQLNREPVFMCIYDDERTASFAYGRVIFGMLNGWRCADISNRAIQMLLKKKENDKADAEEENV